MHAIEISRSENVCHAYVHLRLSDLSVVLRDETNNSTQIDRCQIPDTADRPGSISGRSSHIQNKPCG
jgi:hypothetical protein